MFGYLLRHHAKERDVRAVQRKSEEQLEPEDSSASNITLPIWENTLQFHVASNAGNSAIAHLMSVSNKDGSPEVRRICRRWLEFNPSPEKTDKTQ